MKLTTLFSAVIALTASTLAQAGSSHRGGGNAVVCFNKASTVQEIRNPKDLSLKDLILDNHLPDIKSIITYDLVGMKYPLIPILNGETPKEYFLRLVKRFEQSFPTLAGLMNQGAEAFPEEMIIRDTQPISRIDDERSVGPGRDYKTCLYATMAVQDDVGAMSRLTLDTRLVEKSEVHPIASQYALYVHEFLYKMMRRFGDTDSLRTQILVQMFLADRPLTADQASAQLNNILGHSCNRARTNICNSEITPKVLDIIKNRDVSSDQWKGQEILVTIKELLGIARKKIAASPTVQREMTNVDEQMRLFEHLVGTASIPSSSMKISTITREYISRGRAWDRWKEFANNYREPIKSQYLDFIAHMEKVDATFDAAWNNWARATALKQIETTFAGKFTSEQQIRFTSMVHRLIDDASMKCSPVVNRPSRDNSICSNYQTTEKETAMARFIEELKTLGLRIQ